jgi:4-hydroxy-tetrahydrodipicolinate reductase
MGLEIASLLEGGFEHRGDRLELVDAVAGSHKLRSIEGVEIRKVDEPARETAHVWIDFSRPAGTLALLKTIDSPILIGTTGFTESELASVRKYAEKRAVLLAPNTSPGMNRMHRALQSLGLSPEWGFSAVLQEDHHRHKKDSPSGTAKSLLEALKRLGYDNVDVQVTRAGGIIGNHRVRFISDEEELCIEHRVSDRKVFARGALLGALHLARRKGAGMVTMDDVFEEGKS